MKLYSNKPLIWMVIVSLWLPVFMSTVLYSEPQRDRFVFTQLRYTGGNWDSYTGVERHVLKFMSTTTSIKPYSTRRVVTAEDELLFESPFLVITGDSEFQPFTNHEVENLRRYILGGGLIFVNDITGRKNTGFDLSIRREFKRILPGSGFKIIPRDNAIYRAFYLLRTVGGRQVINNYTEGIMLSNRLVVIYTQNDMLGVWMKDEFGKYVYNCIPGGESQRLEGIKLFANIIMYCVTGTYKTDVIHQPFIQRKLEVR
ncbi:MAG: DUF4159 domain-containing protein [Elusimicrobiota bacterium]